MLCWMSGPSGPVPASPPSLEAPQPLPSALGGTGCLQWEEIRDQPVGQDVSVGSLQEGTP